MFTEDELTSEKRTVPFAISLFLLITSYICPLYEALLPLVLVVFHLCVFGEDICYVKLKNHVIVALKYLRRMISQNKFYL